MKQRRNRPREILAWRAWCSFVLDLQALEAEWSRNHHGQVPKFWVAAQRGVVVVTLTRTMADYGLQANAWPPSTWNPDFPNGRVECVWECVWASRQGLPGVAR